MKYLALTFALTLPGCAMPEQPTPAYHVPSSTLLLACTPASLAGSPRNHWGSLCPNYFWN